MINTTRYKLDQGMRRLIKMNLVKQVGKSPKIHVISDSLKEKLAKNRLEYQNSNLFLF